MKQSIFISIALIVNICTSFGQVHPLITTYSDDTIRFGEKISISIQPTKQVSLNNGKIIYDLSEIKNLAYEQDTARLEKFLDVNLSSREPFDKYIKDNKIEVPVSDLLHLQSQPWEITLDARIYSLGAGVMPSPFLLSESGDTLYRDAGTLLMILPPPKINKDSTAIINDIKPIIAIQTTWRDYLMWIYGVLALLGIGLLWYILSKRKKEPKKEIIPIEKKIKEPAHIIALRALDRLQEEARWKRGEIKEYQSQLTDIIRRYIEDRYNITALEMTTSEVLAAIKKDASMKGQEKVLRDILTVADLVKFAKAEPNNDIHQQFLDMARAFVNQTKTVSNVE